MGLHVARAFAPDDEISALIAALDADLAAGYAAEQQHGLPLAEIFQPQIRFFVARLAGKAVGCGGVALFADFAEAKRMFVTPAARGQGVAQAILSRLEQEAALAGLRWLRLETGDQQLRAMRFYEAAGFARCVPFGDYCAMSPSAIAASIFYEKSL
jgi:putative acetyltransferase